MINAISIQIDNVLFCFLYQMTFFFIPAAELSCYLYHQNIMVLYASKKYCEMFKMWLIEVISLHFMNIIFPSYQRGNWCDILLISEKQFKSNFMNQIPSQIDRSLISMHGIASL